MILLPDTHAILWFWWDDARLSATAKALIVDPANRKLVSSATAWEIAIKVSLGNWTSADRSLDFFNNTWLATASSGFP